jgi:transposase
MTKKDEKKYKRYPKELKAEIVGLAERGELTLKELGVKFDVDPALISQWRTASRNDGVEAFRGRGNRTALEAENEQLKRENRELKLEREILKKAAAYFAKHLS